jgi:NodT family efflux transporter outer membrane factor (OMF) lipoprotein
MSERIWRMPGRAVGCLKKHWFCYDGRMSNAQHVFVSLRALHGVFERFRRDQTGVLANVSAVRSRSVTPILGLACAVVLGGCGVPDAESVSTSGKVPLRGTFAAGQSSVQAQAGLVDVDWLTSFGDAQLSAVVAETLRQSWTLVGAQERVEQARLLAVRAGATLGPIVDGVAGAGWTDPGRGSRNRTTLRLGVAATWELDVWGRVRAAQRGAQADARTIEADFASLREVIAAQAAQSYVLMAVAQRQLSVDEDLLKLRERTLGVAEARLRAGVAQPIDVNVARADVTDSEALVRGSRQALDDAKRSLEILLGRYPSAEIVGGNELPAVPDRVPVGLPSELLERRPDILAADQRVAAAFYRTSEARAARLPRIALTGELGTASGQLRDVLNPENVAWNIGGNLIAPLIDGGARTIDVKIAESQQREALSGYVDAAIRAFGEVETALASEATLKQQAEFLERSVEDLTKARDAAELRYRRGLLSIYELTQVEARLFTARRELVSVRGASVVQRIELHRALGGSFGTARTVEGGL